MTNNKPNDVRVVPVELLEITTSFIESHAEAFAKLNHGKRSEAFDTLSTELRAILAQPADQQGEPFGYWRVHPDTPLQGCFLAHYEESARHVEAAEDMGFIVTRLYAQPSTEKVVLPERMKTRPFQTVDRGSPSYVSAWNACLDEVAKLNTPQ